MAGDRLTRVGPADIFKMTLFEVPGGVSPAEVGGRYVPRHHSESARTRVRCCCLGTILCAAFLLTSVSAAGAYSLSSSGRTGFDDIGQFLLLNGAHNWQRAQVANWGASNGNGGGLSARLSIGMITANVQTLLNYVDSTDDWPVRKRGQPGGFYWNFGTRFKSHWPIREGVGQYNGAGYHQWVWAWANG